jgi:hypothetical protein
VGTNQTVYAKAGIFMPWKQKYRTNANEDATMPYTLPQYDVSREGSAAYLATLSSNLLAVTYDADRAVNWTIAQSRTANATLTENQVLNLKQHSDAAQQTPTTNFPTLASLVSATTTTDGKYNLSEIEGTQYDYLPTSVKTQYVSYVVQTVDTTSSHMWGRDAYDFTTLTTGFMDPVTLRAAHARVIMNNDRLDVNMRLRKSVTGKYYLDTPRTFGSGYIGAYTSYGPRYFSIPLCRSVRSMFGLSAYDPAFTRSVDVLDTQKRFSVFSIVCNTNLAFMGGGGGSVTLPGGVLDIVCGGTRAFVRPQLSMTVASSVCTEVLANNIGGGAITQTGTDAPLIPPVYRVLRTCTNVGLNSAGMTGVPTANNDVVNYPDAAHERLYIITVAIDTTVGGSNAFSSDATMEQYVKVYINGKRINTAARRTTNGTGYATITTSVGSTPGTTYPTYFYPSSSLTYGITQVQDTTYRVSSGNDSAQPGVIWAEGMKYSMAAPYDATNARSFHANQTVTAGSRRPMPASSNRAIVLEAKTESRAKQAYSAAEVDAHITQLSMKWGIVMAYRWITIKNTGTVDFRFARLGLYASHTEAIADVATGTTTDQKTGAFRNVMRGYTTGVASTVSSATVGSSGITAVLGNTTSVAPGITDTTRVTIQPGGSVTIDLGDAVTCSHLLFGSLASTGDVTLARMTVELTPTLTESEAQGIPVTHALRAAKNASGVSEGQFPLYSPATQADTGPFVTAAGAHVNTCGVYVLFAPFWGRAYVGPTAFTYTTAGPVYVTAATAVSITATGADATAATIVVYASTSATSTAPSVVCASAGLSAAGTGSATCVFPSTGTYYLFLKARGPDGTVQSAFVSSGSAPVSVVAYELPTSISDATIGALVVGTTTTARTLTLSGPGLAALTQPNITVYVGAPGNCTVTAYNNTSGLVTFTVTPTVSGMCSVYAVVAAPVAGSTQTTTLVFTGPTTQGFFVDAATSVAWTPVFTTTALWLDASDSSTITTVSGGVSEWRDKSGNSRHAAQATAGSRPGTGTLNGLPVVAFDGVDDFMDVTTSALQGQAAPNVFYVFVQTSAGSGGYRPVVATITGSDDGAFHYVNPSGLGASYPYNTRGWGTYDGGTAAYTTGSSELISFATLAGAFSVYRNGTLEGGATAGTAQTASTGIRLAQQPLYARVSGISLAEVVIIFGATSAQRESVEGYLAWKWGIVSKLPAGHAHKSSRPMTTGASNYTMPTSFTYTAPGCVDGNPTTMTVTATGASAAAAPIAVFYGASAGISTTAALTQCGAGSLASGTSSVTVAIPTGTWYVYIRVTSPVGAVGPIVGAAAALTVRAYVHATSVASVSPTTVVEGVSASLAVTLGGYDTGSTGTAAVYYHATSGSLVPTLVGTAALVSGVATVTLATLPQGSYYVYARTIGPSGVQGPLVASGTAVLTSRAYVFPTSVTCTAAPYATLASPVTLAFAPAETVGATITVFYHATNSSSSPTQCGTGTLAATTGTGTATCTLPAGTYFIYARVTAPSGAVSGLICTTVATTVQPIPLLVRYIRITNITTTDSLWCGKVGLYSSSEDAAADTGSSTKNVVYAARATATVTVNSFWNDASQASSIAGTSASICGLTTWAHQDSTNYFWLKQPPVSTIISSYVTIDLGASFAVYEMSGLFFRLGICSGYVPYSRLRCQVSADGLTYYERLLSWTTGGTTYDAKNHQWYTVPTGKQMQMVPTSFAMTNRTTGTPRDLSVDANRTGVTRGLRKWDVISISSQDFSNSYAPTETWWWITNGGRGHANALSGYTGSVENAVLGYDAKVGGGLVYSHNVYSLNCTSLCLTTTWETGGYTHLWVVSASNDQVNWTEMATGSFSDATKMVPWTPSASDGGILWQGPGTGTYNRFYKLSWANTQYYVYWRLGIKTAGTPMSGSFCNCGGIYELEWN